MQFWHHTQCEVQRFIKHAIGMGGLYKHVHYKKTGFFIITSGVGCLSDLRHYGLEMCNYVLDVGGLKHPGDRDLVEGLTRYLDITLKSVHRVNWTSLEDKQCKAFLLCNWVAHMSICKCWGVITGSQMTSSTH